MCACACKMISATQKNIHVFGSSQVLPSLMWSERNRRTLRTKLDWGHLCDLNTHLSESSENFGVFCPLTAINRADRRAIIASPTQLPTVTSPLYLYLYRCHSLRAEGQIRTNFHLLSFKVVCNFHQFLLLSLTPQTSASPSSNDGCFCMAVQLFMFLEGDRNEVHLAMETCPPPGGRS